MELRAAVAVLVQQTCNQPIKFGLALHTTTEVLALAIAKVEIANFAEPTLKPNSPKNTELNSALSSDLNSALKFQKHQTWLLGRELSSQIHNHLKTFLEEFKQEFKEEYRVECREKLNEELLQTSSGSVGIANGSIWDNLAWIAIAKGVGSFTSTRVGIVLARTLGQQLDIPVYAIDCEAIASHAEQSQLDLAESLWQLVNQQWRNQLTAENPDLKHPHWSEALPAYGGEFGSSS
jgi:tRNA threonylcarbamoyladenosine biosynthesis protein TsaB